MQNLILEQVLNSGIHVVCFVCNLFVRKYGSEKFNKL